MFYKSNLKKAYLPYLSQSNVEYTGWVVIPSMENDPVNFSDNVKKLKILSYESRCTKNTKAELYLEKGDFYLYFDNGKLKILLK